MNIFDLVTSYFHLNIQIGPVSLAILIQGLDLAVRRR